MIAGSLNGAAADALDRATGAALLRGRHGTDGLIRQEPAAAGLDGALGRLLLIVSRAQIDGSWRRVKACASTTCRGVVWDRSGNRSARWCRPHCGNRESSRAAKRRVRSIARRDREARQRATALAHDHYKVPSLAELEDDPHVGYLARQLREQEEGE